jgi:hypothetical protein
LPSPQGRRYEIFESDAPLSFERALSLLANEAGFRRWFSETLAQSDFAAYRWETPPLSKSLASRRFEFALVEDRGLERAPDESAFAAYFPDTPHNVVAVQNLSRTSDLIVPRRIAAASAYPHLAAFLRGAPAEQVDALWRCVAETVNRRLSDRPLWLSTAGAGVAWLHVRVDPVPKYYAYRPYREDALRD